MIRSFDLLPEPPRFGALPNSADSLCCVCRKTPPSFYDTPESCDVKRILALPAVFLPVFSGLLAQKSQFRPLLRIRPSRPLLGSHLHEFI
jgi:hypothetical protein